tara:strand:+ start:69 stop:905 length:837 start_codon:yes stop_codon:yes gene_type:complete
MINQIAFGTSLLVAGVAAYFSVIGLATIFAGSFWPVVVMAGVLEIGKLVTAGFLHLRWSDINRAMRYYLMTSVVVLMLITSLGIFGFLAKANIEQTLQGDSYSLELSILDKRLDAKEKELGRFEERLANLDFIIDTARPEDRNYIDRRQRDERAQIATDIDLVVSEIVELNEEKMPIQREQLVQEGEIGPIKYVAEMLYGEDVAKDKLDNAARILIFFIIFAFDPLAVLLLVASLGIMARENDPLNPAFSTDEVAVPKEKIADGNDYIETKRRFFPRK